MAQILVIDDNDGWVGVMKDALEGLGHRVEAAEGANEAVKVVLAQEFDLVTVDQALKRSTGTTAALALRGLGFAGPMVLLTGGIVPVDEGLMKKADFAAVLHKTDSLAELVAALQALLPDESGKRPGGQGQA